MAPYHQIPERLRQERAEIILDVAEALFAEKGYHATSMSEIAAHKEAIRRSQGTGKDFTMLQTLSTLDDVQNTYGWFEQMRETQPVWLDERSGCWHVFRYEDVHTTITDYHTFSSERRRPGFLARRTAQSADGQIRAGRSLLTMDPPEHRQYRNLVSYAFTPRAIDRLRGRVAEITQELLDAARSEGRMDFATEIAYPLPTIVIAELLGVPISDRPLFRRWA